MYQDFLFATPPSLPTRPLIIDSFAGGGGASTGIEMALGRSPDVAINHSAAALALHAANHPDTLHLSENVWQVDPLDVVRNRQVGLAWFSPDCCHFSSAKGGQPVKKNIRDLAWVVVLWARRVRPEVIVVENVEEFTTWGPLVERDGKMYPDPSRTGTTFAKWVSDLKRLGYRVDWKVLKACDFGAPTIRERFFLVARRDGRPIVWPTPTHGPSRAKPYRTAADILDWSLPVPSIFASRAEIKEEHGLDANRPLVENTMARLARGVKKFVLDAERPFLLPGTGPATDRREAVAAFLTQSNGDTKPSGRSYPKPGRPVDEPLSTLTTTGSQQSLVAVHMLSMKGEQRRDGPVTDPLPTICAGATHAHVVYSFLTKFYGCGIGHALDEPCHTLTTKEKFGLVTVEVGGEPYAIVDIGLRMLTPRELYRAQGFPVDYRIDATVDGKAIPKKTQVSCVGNSVCPDMAAAIVGANCGHLIEADIERIAA